MSIEGMKPEDISRLAAWADTVLANPQTRKTALEMTKKVNPNFTHAELEVDDRLAKVKEENAATLLKMQTEMQTERIERARAEKTRELKAAGFDIEAVEKVMADNSIGSYETAMKFMKQESQLAPATPAHLSSGNAQMPEGFKDIAKNPARWAREKAAELLNQAKQGIAI